MATDIRTTTAGAAALCALLAFSSGALAGDKAKMMDANGDGVVSSAEHAAGAKKMFDAMDGNRDGNVTAAEMDSYKASKKPDPARAGHEMSSSEKIKAIDTNGDGVLSAAEHASGSQGKFAEMDSNGDGNLTAAEMKAGHEAMKTAKGK